MANSVSCKDCKPCSNCAHCENCQSLSKCNNCKDSKWCVNSTGLTDCMLCEDCVNCTWIGIFTKICPKCGPTNSYNLSSGKCTCGSSTRDPKPADFRDLKGVKLPEPSRAIKGHRYSFTWKFRDGRTLKVYFQHGINGGITTCSWTSNSWF